MNEQLLIHCAVILVLCVLVVGSLIRLGVALGVIAYIVVELRKATAVLINHYYPRYSQEMISRVQTRIEITVAFILLMIGVGGLIMVIAGWLA